MKPRIAFWLGLWTWIFLAATPSLLHAQNKMSPPAAASTQDGQKDAQNFAQDLEFARFIALIRGHLLTGDELAGQREWDLASRHFGYPREEIYGVIREQLRAYKTPAFDGDLKALVRAAKSRNAKQYAKVRAKVEAALDAADAELKSRQPNWHRFTMAVAMQVLKSAPDEFDDAVGTDRNSGLIVHPIGYQTARGFILQADRMVESVAGDFAGNNAAALADMRAGFAQLKQAFANVNAPKQPPIGYPAMLEIVARIEGAAGKLK